MTPGLRQVLLWAATGLSLALTVGLGVWQLSRADQKVRAHQEMVGRQALPPWTEADWPCQGRADVDSLPQYRPVALRGHWLPGRTVFLENRPMDGASGFVVVTPLRLVGGACDGRLILVQRGWVPRDPADRLRLPELATSQAEVVVPGRVLGAVSQVYALGQEDGAAPAHGPVIRQNADLVFWAHWLGQAPVAGAVLQMQAEVPAPAVDILRRHWPVPGSGKDKHLAYAAQWFALAAGIVGLTVWFQLLRSTRENEHVCL